MKMTMHIDEDVLAQVMEITGAKSKTKAVEMALKEMARKHKMRKLFKEGLGLMPDQLKAEFAPGPADELYDQGLIAAESPAPYGKPPPVGQ